MRALLLLPLFILCAAGCSSTKINQAEVTGKVFYHGQALPGGVVTFISAKGFSSTATIDPQGNYHLTAPVGELKIGVDNRMLRPHAQGGQRMLKRPADAGTPQQLAGTYVPMPDRYHSPDTSGLTRTLTKGPQTVDIRLE